MTSIERRDFLNATGATAIGLATTALAQRSARAADKITPIKVGQIGTRHAHAAGQIATLRKYRDVFEIVGIVEPNVQRRKELARHAAYKGLPWMTEEQLLSVKGLQAVAVETGVRDLVPTAGRCVAAGMHVHIDKPAGESLAEFKKVLDAAASKKLAIRMGYMFRGNPAFQFCFKAVRDGWLGQIFEAHGVISKTVGAGTRKALSQYAGGSMFELGCHLIDPLVTLMGKPDRVTAYVRRTRPEQDELADNQLAVMEYPKATATIRSALVEVNGSRRRQFTICGDQGTIEIRPLEPPRLELTLSKPRGKFKRGTQTVSLPKSPGRYDENLLDWARTIRGEQPNPYPPAHDLAVHETILRACGVPLNSVSK